MSQEVLSKNEVARVTEMEVRHEVRPRELLDVLVESVKRDSKNEASAFLAETTVPYGGE